MSSEQDPYYFCGNIERVGEVTGAWNKRLLFYKIQAQIPGLSEDELEQAYALAFSYWSEVCGLQFQKNDAPDIRATAGVIDGPSRVLAWSELPAGDDRMLNQKYDSSERFVNSASPPQGKIDIVAVMCHEIGHALGLQHAPQGSPDLMAPIYQPGRRKPQPGDIQRIQALYGPPVPVNPPSPPGGGPDEPDVLVIIGRSGRETARFKLTRL